jgi:hypothetical protein
LFRRFLLWAVGVLLLAVGPLRADDAEDAAVVVIEDLGGATFRDEDDPAGPITKVDFYHTKVTDPGLKELIALKHLKELNLAECHSVTVEGLKEVVRLKALRMLDLSDIGSKQPPTPCLAHDAAFARRRKSTRLAAVERSGSCRGSTGICFLLRRTQAQFRANVRGQIPGQEGFDVVGRLTSRLGAAL